MRTRFLPLGAAIAVAVGLLTAAPAAAAYGVESITFPGGDAEFYSPFSGPASIKFTFNGSENDAIFSVRIRPVGGTAVHSENVFVDADDPDGFKVKTFNWPAISVNGPKTYVVAVYRNGAHLASESFFLHPRLVTITSAAPNPFFPWIDDGHKDSTNVGFNLAAGSDAQARVFRPNRVGKCCGALVRNDDLGPLTAGSHNWSWDGRDDGGANLAKGDYFVRIRADDGIVSPALSKAAKVAIARTYRATKTKSKTASAYHHVGPVTPLVIGGDCIVYRTNGDLEILCQGGRVSVYWRWGLSPAERIQRASFVLDTVEGCPRSIRRTGHTKHESSFTMNEDLVGAAGDCLLTTARITYSYPQAS
jgi:flagellar hook capping protein FlgD